MKLVNTHIIPDYAQKIAEAHVQPGIGLRGECEICIFRGIELAVAVPEIAQGFDMGFDFLFAWGRQAGFLGGINQGMAFEGKLVKLLVLRRLASELEEHTYGSVFLDFCDGTGVCQIDAEKWPLMIFLLKSAYDVRDIVDE